MLSCHRSIFYSYAPGHAIVKAGRDSIFSLALAVVILYLVVVLNNNAYCCFPWLYWSATSEVQQVSQIYR